MDIGFVRSVVARGCRAAAAAASFLAYWSVRASLRGDGTAGGTWFRCKLQCARLDLVLPKLQATPPHRGRCSLARGGKRAPLNSTPICCVGVSEGLISPGCTLETMNRDW